MAHTLPISGATRNSHNWRSAQPPTNNAGPILRAGLTEVFVTGNPDEMDQGQRQADGDARELRVRARVAGCEHRENEQESEDRLDGQGRSDVVASR